MTNRPSEILRPLYDKYLAARSERYGPMTDDERQTRIAVKYAASREERIAELVVKLAAEERASDEIWKRARNAEKERDALKAKVATLEAELVKAVPEGYYKAPGGHWYRCDLETTDYCLFVKCDPPKGVPA